MSLHSERFRVSYVLRMTIAKVIGRNVKRRIEELEQQVASQAGLLTFPNETGKPWPVGTSSHETRAAIAQPVRDIRAAHEKRKVFTLPVAR